MKINFQVFFEYAWYTSSALDVIQDCVHTMPAHFENGENVTDRLPVHTKTAHFLPADFEIGTLTGIFWKRHRVSTQKIIKKNIFQCFWNETDQFLECRYISLASMSCNEFLPSDFLPFSNCLGIV